MNKIAFDKASVRTRDEDGRLHVAISNISKADVNPYNGSEIPNWEGLGLDPNRVYFLLRDPEELAASAGTFNNLPVISKHVLTTANDPQKDLIIGTTGTDAAFNAPFLCNSLAIWDAAAIVGIESRVQCELSCGYRYEADMTPGKFAGVQYDGIMRNIRGNHVALVTEGRAGPDVVIGDSKLLEVQKMSKRKLSATAMLVRSALATYLTPKLAQDAKIGDLSAVVGSIKSATFAKDKPALIEKITATFKPQLAKDASLGDLTDMLDALEDEMDGSDDDGMTDDASPGAQLLALLGSAGLAPDVMAKVQALCGAKGSDAFPPKAAAPAAPDGGAKPPVAVGKPAMDAAIATAVQAAEAATVARMNAIRVAEKEVAPLLGEIAAMDSAESIYKLALDQAKVDLTGVHPSAYRAMVKMQITTSTAIAPVQTRLATDAANVTSFTARFPNATKLKGGA